MIAGSHIKLPDSIYQANIKRINVQTLQPTWDIEQLFVVLTEIPTDLALLLDQ